VDGREEGSHVKQRRATAPGRPKIPARRENWAEAVFQGGAKCVVTTRSGHVLLSDEPAGFPGGAGGANTGPTPTGLLASAFAADIPVMVQRIARELGIEIAGMRARVTIAWNPRVIAGIADGSPAPAEALSEIWLSTSAAPKAVARLREEYERRCPLYNLFRQSGCRMTEVWKIVSSRRRDAAAKS
jgi:uncharacterized OsmC-like protein